MLKVLLFLFLYMLYGVLLTVFMVKFKIFDVHKEVKNDLNFILFFTILISPIMTLAIIVYILPRRLFKYLMGMPVMPEDNTDKRCPTYTQEEIESTKL